MQVHSLSVVLCEYSHASRSRMQDKINWYQGVVIMMEQKYLISIFKTKLRGSIFTEVLMSFCNLILVLWHMLILQLVSRGRRF